jgi:hypothetical protein
MKKFIVLFVFALGALTVKSQVNLEQQIADSACVCLSALDTANIKSKSNSLKMECLQKAMTQNHESIIKNMDTEKRKEEDEQKLGIKGSLMIKVQNILAVQCAAYKLFEQKVQERRQP